MDRILVRRVPAVEPDEWEGGEENRLLTKKGKEGAASLVTPADAVAGLATSDVEEKNICCLAG
jgi:hypothetical protein